MLRMPDQQIRYRSVKMRALPDGKGAFEALGAAYGVTYDTFDWWRGEGKERLAPGVFAESIAEKSTLPVFWLHGWELAPVGDTKAHESDKGAVFPGQFYIEDSMANRVYRGVGSGALDEWSIGWIAEDTHIEKENGEDVEVADRGRLIELSSVVLGANPGTETISVRGIQRAGFMTLTEQDLLTRMRSLMPQLASAPAPPREPIAEDEARRMLALVSRGLMTEDEAVRLIVEGGGVGADRNR